MYFWKLFRRPVVPSPICIDYTSLLLFFTDLEWILSESGAIKTELEKDPRKRREIRDVLTSSLRSSGQCNQDDDDDDDSD